MNNTAKITTYFFIAITSLFLGVLLGKIDHTNKPEKPELVKSYFTNNIPVHHTNVVIRTRVNTNFVYIKVVDTPVKNDDTQKGAEKLMDWK